MTRITSFLVMSSLCLAAPVWIIAQSVPTKSAETGAPLTLDALVREATERNPEILAARRAVEAKRARIPQAGAWADPTVSLSYGGNAFPPFTVMRADPSSMIAHSPAVCQCNSRTPPAVSLMFTPAKVFDTASSRTVTSRDHPPSYVRLFAKEKGYLNV